MREYVPVKDVRQFLLKNLYKNEQGQYQWRVNLTVIERFYSEILAGQEHFQTPFVGDALFIKGGDSDYLLPEHREQTLRLFPDAVVRIIPDTGHWVHAQKPELMIKMLLRFFGG